MNSVQSPLFDHFLALGVSQSNNLSSKAHDDTESSYNKATLSYGKSDLSYGKTAQQDVSSELVINRVKDADLRILPVPEEERYRIQPVIPSPVDEAGAAERERTGILVGLAEMQNQNKNIEALLDGLDHSVEEDRNHFSLYGVVGKQHIRSNFSGVALGLGAEPQQGQQVHTKSIVLESSLGLRVDIQV